MPIQKFNRKFKSKAIPFCLHNHKHVQVAIAVISIQMCRIKKFDVYLEKQAVISNEYQGKT